MAIALGSGGYVSADDALVTAYTADTGSDRLLVGLHAAERGAGQSGLITQCYYDLVPMNEVAGCQYDLNGTTISVWWLPDASIGAGPNDFTADYNNVPNGGEHFAALTLTGVDQVAPVQASDANDANMNLVVTSNAITAAADGFSCAVGNYARAGTTAVISGTGFTAETSYPGSSSSALSTGSKVETAGGSFTATHTVTGAAADRRNHISTVTWTPAAGGGSGRTIGGGMLGGSFQNIGGGNVH